MAVQAQQRKEKNGQKAQKHHRKTKRKDINQTNSTHSIIFSFSSLVLM
jgi:hypothetical protein